MRINKGVFKYINESKDNYDAQRILDAMSSFEGSFSTSEFNVDTTGDEFIEIFMECLLYKSQKSLQHLKKLANRFLNMIKSTLSDERRVAKALEVVSNVWINDEQKEINILDQLINQEIVSPATMTKYLFERIRVNGITKNMYAKEWKMLNKLISKQLIKFTTVMNINGDEQGKMNQMPLSQLDDMEDVEHTNKEEIVNETKQLISTIIESFDICEQNIQESPSQDANENQNNEFEQPVQIPIEKRVENIQSRKKAITRSLFQNKLIKSLMA